MNNGKPAAPAVDDDLLHELAPVFGVDSPHGIHTRVEVRERLASEPMQRLKSAWTAEAVRERDDLALRLEGVEAHRERLLEDARKRDAELAAAAVPALPDVDPEAFWMDGVEVRDDALGVLWANRGHAVEWAASALHALTLFDAEAALLARNGQEAGQ